MIILANKSGQMCNQIIEFMHPYVMALEYGHNIIQLQKKDYEKYFECKIDKNVRYTGIEWRILNFWSKTKSLFRYVFHIKGKMIRQNHEKLKAKVRGRRVCLLRDSFFVILMHWKT